MLTLANKGGRGVWTPKLLADIICEQPLTRYLLVRLVYIFIFLLFLSFLSINTSFFNWAIFPLFCYIVPYLFSMLVVVVICNGSQTRISLNVASCQYFIYFFLSNNEYATALLYQVEES